MINLNIDREIDKKQLEWAKEGNVIFDSWAMPWLLKEGFKIWLEASKEVRAKRIAGRDNISVSEAKKFLRKKENRTIKIYKKLYNFTLGKDFAPFNLILTVDKLGKDEVFKIISLIIDNVVIKN